MRIHAYIIIILALVSFFACEPQEEIVTKSSDVQLSFSSDTIAFDTIFTSVKSITKRFRARNHAENAVIIDRIFIAGGESSPYSMLINGREGKSFSDQFLLGEDSLLILVEVDLDQTDENNPFLIKDSIIFETNGNSQHVKLRTWGQDAYFLNKRILACDTTWTAQKPIVLLDSVLLDSACDLTIEAGTKIYADQLGTLLIGGSLLVNGTVDEPVLFTSARLDIKDAFGQWNGLFFLTTSRNNQISHAIIRNAFNGIYLGTPDQDTIPDLQISNTRIENMANIGLIAFTSDIHAYNLLINNCAVANLANLAGGNYVYKHSTFANFSRDFIREGPSVIFSNHLQGDLLNDLKIDLHNSIVWGDQQEELEFNFVENATTELFFSHSILKTALQEFEINENILNENPKFIDPGNYDYHLDTLSPAKDHGSTMYRVSEDLDGQERDSLPDLGVFERIE